MGSDERDSFGALLRQHRLSAALTQQALAEQAGLSVRGLAFLEHGARRPYPDTVRRLADALDLAGEPRAAFMAAAQAGPVLPVRASTAPPPITGNLPAALTSLIGRDASGLRISGGKRTAGRVSFSFYKRSGEEG